MGQRSRKRVRNGVAQEGAVIRQAPTNPVRERPGPPPPPWSPLPLSELAIGIGILLLLSGVLWGGSRGRTLGVSGGLLASAGALEVAVREHVTGYRSHSSLLSLAAAAVTVGLLLGVLTLPGSAQTQLLVAVVAAVAVFAVSLFGWRELFRRRSGGLTFRA